VRRRLLLIAALLVVAAGCQVDVTVTTTMRQDGSGQVVVSVQPDDELLAKVPTLFDELRLTDVADAGWTVAGPDAHHVLTLSKPFATPAEANQVLAELNGPQGPLRGLTLSQSYAFARTSSAFSGSVQLEGGLSAFADADLVQLAGGVPLTDRVTVPIEEGLKLHVVVVLPGDARSTTATTVVEHDGAATFSWQPSVAAGAVTALDAHAVLHDRGAVRARWLARGAWVALAVYVVAMIVLVVWVVRRPSRRAPPP
jgi:hypothetical protein